MNKKTLTLITLATLVHTTSVLAAERIDYPLRQDLECVSPKHDEGRITWAGYRIGTRQAGCTVDTVSIVAVDEAEIMVTIVPPVVAVDDVPTVETVKEKKQKCNNGEGNGGEGCSPANSEHANNDENNTSPSEDHGRP